MLEAAVDCFGRAVEGAGSVEVGRHVGGTFVQGPPESEQFGQCLRDADTEGGDQCL